MKLFKKIRKGFTLIELVVVIAVIAILSAVSVVSYVAITNKAHQSNDQQLIDQVNLSLDSHGISKKPSTMHEALQGVEEDGFIPANMKISPEYKGYTFAYNLKDNQFVILNEKKDVVYPKDARKDAAHYELWLFADGEADVEGEFKDYSHYVRAFEWSSTTDNVLTAEAGLDLGSIKNIGKVKYATNEAQDVVIRTVGDQTELEVDAPNSNADFYGFTKKLDVTRIKNASLHIYGTVYKMEVESGHVAVENTGIVFKVEEVASSASVSNSGYVAEAAAGVTISGTQPSSEYEINSLERLEGFRDAVNAGNSFKNKIVKLTRDIALNDGWTPIGEGSRDVGATNTSATGVATFFQGEFNGNGKTISNLNNKGFVPTSARITDDKGEVKQYAYGLFALVGDGAYIHHLKMRGVDFDASRYSGALADSVGAIVGYSNGSLRLENNEVSGSLKANDSVGGVLGRAYPNKAGVKAEVEFIVKNNTNNASVTADISKGHKGAGVVGYLSNFAGIKTVSIEGNANTGTISGGASYSGSAETTYVADGTGTYTLRASIAVASSGFADTMHSGNTNGGVAVTLRATAVHGTKSLGAL